MAIAPLEQSPVLSEYKRKLDRPLVRGGGGAGCESALPRAAPKFYEFAHIKAPHSTRLTAPKLPPEQHIGMGGTDHDKTHVWFTHDNTVPASY
jgi:hypothetical protein